MRLNDSLAYSNIVWKVYYALSWLQESWRYRQRRKPILAIMHSFIIYMVPITMYLYNSTSIICHVYQFEWMFPW